MSDNSQEIKDLKERIEILEYKKKVKELESDIDSKGKPTQKAYKYYEETKYGLVPALNDKRLINLIIDTVVIYILSYLMGYVIGAFFPQTAYYIYLTGDTTLWYLGGFLMYVGYYCILEGVYGRTVGKMLTGTKVVTEEGKKPSFSQIIGRTLGRLIPFEFITFLSTRPIGLHDSLSKTVLISMNENDISE